MQKASLELETCSGLEFIDVISMGWRKEARWAMDVLQRAVCRCVKNSDAVDAQCCRSAVCEKEAVTQHKRFKVGYRWLSPRTSQRVHARVDASGRRIPPDRVTGALDVDLSCIDSY